MRGPVERARRGRRAASPPPGVVECVADVAGVLFVVLFLLWDARDVVVLLLLWGLRDPNFDQPAHLLALVKCRLLRTAGVYDEYRIIDGDRCLGDIRREDHLPN